MVPAPPPAGRLSAVGRRSGRRRKTQALANPFGKRRASGIKKQQRRAIPLELRHFRRFVKNRLSEWCLDSIHPLSKNRAWPARTLSLLIRAAGCCLTGWGTQIYSAIAAAGFPTS